MITTTKLFLSKNKADRNTVAHLEYIRLGTKVPVVLYDIKGYTDDVDQHLMHWKSISLRGLSGPIK